jgi:hypothetical protein
MRYFVMTMVLCASLFSALGAEAAIIQFDLIGRSGAGLLGTNENPTAGLGSTGGEVGAGISFNDVSNVLTINVAWGTANGFNNLTGNATAMHIHQAPGPNFLTTNGGVIIGLDGLGGFNSSATAGGLSDTVTLTSGQKTSLLAGALYINVHTATFGGGEIRGNLSAVPEPTSIALVSLFGAGLFVAKRKRRSLFAFASQR